MYHRIVTEPVTNALATNSIVLVQGPRQVGKTTLVRAINQTEPKYEFCSLDVASELELAKSNPANFLRRKNYLIIDEVLRAPELINEIKNCVNEDPLPGKFLLTSSENIISFPNVHDKLASKSKFITMSPFAQCELHGKPSHFLNMLFNGNFSETSSKTKQSKLNKVLLTGGFPEALNRASEDRRTIWMSSYLESIYHQLSVKSANGKSRDSLAQFVRNLASFSGQLIGQLDFHNSLNVSSTTYQRYLEFLEQKFLIRRIKSWPPYSVNQLREPIKLQFIDSGLLASLKNFQPNTLDQNQPDFDSIFNCFVSNEIFKLVNQPEHDYSIFYYRTPSNEIVDLVLVRNDGLVAGLVIQPRDSLAPTDINALDALKLKSGQKFSCGIILYNGTTIQNLADNFFAIPVSLLLSS